MGVAQRIGFPNRLALAAVAGLCLVAGVVSGLNPKYGLYLGVGLMFAVVTITDLTLGFVLFTIASFIDVLSGSGTVSATKVIGLVLLGSWLARVATRRRSEISSFATENPGMTAALVAMLAWAALSFTWAASPSTVLKGSLTYLLDMMLVPIGYAAIRRREHLVWVLAAFVFGAVLSSVYGFVHPTAATSMQAGRATGLNGDANAEATIAAASIPLLACLFGVWRDSARLKLVAVIGLVVLFLGLVNTVSREGLVSLAAVLVGGVVFGGRWRRWAALLLVVGAVGTIGYFVLLASPTARNRVTNPSSSGRSSLWTVAERVFEAHPVLGVGLNNFSLVEQQYVNQPGSIQAYYVVQIRRVTHNTLLEAAADLGVPGVLTLLAVLAAALSAVIRAVRIFEQIGDEPMELLSRGLFLALVAVLASDVFVAGASAKYLWIPLALCPATLYLARRAQGARNAEAWDPAIPVVTSATAR